MEMEVKASFKKICDVLEEWVSKIGKDIFHAELIDNRFLRISGPDLGSYFHPVTNYYVLNLKKYKVGI